MYVTEIVCLAEQYMGIYFKDTSTKAASFVSQFITALELQKVRVESGGERGGDMKSQSNSGLQGYVSFIEIINHVRFILYISFYTYFFDLLKIQTLQNNIFTTYFFYIRFGFYTDQRETKTIRVGFSLKRLSRKRLKFTMVNSEVLEVTRVSVRLQVECRETYALILLIV